MEKSLDKRSKRPGWLRVKALSAEVRKTMSSALLGLHTVCEEANCPNIGECWGRRTATFMILGDICTRKCSFCAVATGRPREVNPYEPEILAKSAQRLGLKHVVITSVNRDDLPDGGASQFVACIEALRMLPSPPTVEVLTPDFKGDAGALFKVLFAFPDVFNHNVETVPRLYRTVRIGARYEWSIAQLRRAKDFAVANPRPNAGVGLSLLTSSKQVAANGASILIKSGLMLGLGESFDEVVQVLADLRDAGVDLVTIGQYLKPLNQEGKHDVVRYVPPEEFNELAEVARELGFLGVASGPLVRSSYFADAQLAKATNGE